MSERDPRTDPRSGDVIGGRRVVSTPHGGVTDLSVTGEGFFLWLPLERWQELNATAEVVKIGADRG